MDRPLHSVLVAAVLLVAFGSTPSFAQMTERTGVVAAKAGGADNPPGDDRGGGTPAPPGDDRGGGSGNGGNDPGSGQHDQGELRGIVQALPAAGLTGDWNVAGRRVTVLAATRIDQEVGAVSVGAVVEIHGTADPTGALLASTIEVVSSSAAPAPAATGARVEILGQVDALPSTGSIGTWTVAERAVVMSASTVIDTEHGAVKVGATVEIEAVKQADGSLAAVRLEVKPGQGAAVAPAHFWGHVTALPDSGGVGVWRVDDKIVDASESTRIEVEHGAVVLQAIVEVEGWLQADGSIAAKSIETRSASGDLPGQSAQAIEFHHARLGRFFISAAKDEIAALDRGGEWQRTGETFNTGGDEAACRFYGMPPRGPDSHFFTIDASECAKVMADMPAWTFEGFAFSITAPNADGACPAGLTSVHRLYNQATRAEDMNHRYVASAAAIASTVASGWVDEGAVMCARP